MLQDNVTNHVYVSSGNAIVCSIDAVPSSGFALYDIAVASGAITSVVDQRSATTDLLPTPSGTLTASKTLTDAQIKALPTGVLDMIPAPGAGKVIVPQFAAFWTSFAAAAYTNVSAQNGALGVGWNDGGGNFGVSNTFGIVYDSNGSLLTFAGRQFFPIVLGTVNDGVGGNFTPGNETSHFENRAIALCGYNQGAAYTGGNAANSLVVVVKYTIEDVPA
jgi:hypothetical protein